MCSVSGQTAVPGPWSLHIGDIGQGGAFDVPAEVWPQSVHQARRGLEAEAKKQFWTRIVTGSAPAQWLQIKGGSEHQCLELSR